jgi:hypothetical protein
MSENHRSLVSERTAEAFWQVAQRGSSFHKIHQSSRPDLVASTVDELANLGEFNIAKDVLQLLKPRMDSPAPS